MRMGGYSPAVPVPHHSLHRRPSPLLVLVPLAGLIQPSDIVALDPALLSRGGLTWASHLRAA
jgi:hypothetical protein